MQWVFAASYDASLSPPPQIIPRITSPTVHVDNVHLCVCLGRLHVGVVPPLGCDVASETACFAHGQQANGSDLYACEVKDDLSYDWYDILVQSMFAVDWTIHYNRGTTAIQGENFHWIGSWWCLLPKTRGWIKGEVGVASVCTSLYDWRKSSSA